MSHVLILAGFLAFPIFERLPTPPLAGQWSEGGQRCRPAFSGTGITVAGTASDFPLSINERITEFPFKKTIPEGSPFTKTDCKTISIESFFQ